MPIRFSAVVLLLAVGLAVLQYRQHPGEAKDTPFEEIRPNIFRHANAFPLLPAPFLPVPTATWLIRGPDKHSWILIDAGPSTPTYQQSFRAALQSTLNDSKDQLKLILLTHGHPDHIEGLDWLLDAYPHAQLGFHENEAWLVTGGGQVAEMQGDTLIFSIGKYTQGVNSSRPAHRSMVLKGESGDVASSLSGILLGAPSWLPAGILKYVHTPGHAPGHLVFIHTPSKSVIAGDAFSHQSGWWPFYKGGPSRIGRPYPIATYDNTLMRASQKRIAQLPGISMIFASHDDDTGTTADALKAYTSGFPDA